MCVLFFGADCIYFKASAWRDSFYGMNWPYDHEISLAYFEARVDKIVKELTKFHLSFVAFEVDSGISEYSSYSVVVIGHRL